MRSIDPFLLSKINQQNQTIYNNANPKVSVQVSRAKTTVSDSTYWTVETIRERTGLGDLSVAARRQKAYGPPNRIYNIYIENNVVRTAIREYPDYLKEKWKDQFDLGPGTAGAIAFDGNWERWRKKWQLVTEEKPYIFWVDSAGILWTQIWDEIGTKLQLATDVVKVKAIRAWKNTEVPEIEQGLVVGYIKTDGKVYYRNYCYQTTSEYVWEYEKQIVEFVGTIINLNMFITNDYRMGFITEDSIGNISWVITPRSWSGMAIPAEKIITGITDINLSVIPIAYYNFNNDEHITTGITDLFLNVAEPIYPVPLSANNGNKNEYTIWLLFSHEIYSNVTQAVSAFTIKDSANKVYNIISMEHDIDKSIAVFHMEHFAAASGDMTIIYNRTLYEIDSKNQGSLFAIESFNLTFTPNLAPPEGHMLENATVAIVPTLTVTQVYYKDRSTQENAKASIADITIIVTKVGNNPL